MVSLREDDGGSAGVVRSVAHDVGLVVGAATTDDDPVVIISGFSQLVPSQYLFVMSALLYPFGRVFLGAGSSMLMKTGQHGDEDDGSADDHIPWDLISIQRVQAKIFAAPHVISNDYGNCVVGEVDDDGWPEI